MYGKLGVSDHHPCYGIFMEKLTTSYMFNADNKKFDNFYENSYERHANWYQKMFPSYEQKLAALDAIGNYKGSINHWLQDIFFNCLTPLLKNKDNSWLTVGDAYGHDAKYLIDHQVVNVIATDLQTDFLAVSKEKGFIDQYSAQNAENLSFKNNSVDYLLCKESYHHFPRPYAALYEMIRVAKKGVIIMEPQDPISKMPLLLFLTNVLERFRPGTSQKIWKNRFSYEKVGNFVYKISQREVEKFAAGLNLPMVAIKQINPNFWFKGSDKIPAVNSESKFRKIRFKKAIRDFMMKTGILPGQTLTVIIFKDMPNNKLQNSLKAQGYKLISIPKNPYV